MIKRWLLALFGLLLLVAAIAGVKVLQIKKMIKQGESFVMPPTVVSAVKAQKGQWETTASAIGSFVAVQGLDLSADLSGRVVEIAFDSDTTVKAGDLLIRQDISSEQAQLRAVEARITLAELSLSRLERLLAQKTVAQSDYDDADARLKEHRAEADDIRATIAKKTIRAPFSGRLGIRRISLGQMLNGGETIVSLQKLDPIYVHFSLPQELVQVSKGYLVRVTSDAFPDVVAEGRISAINAQVNPDTRGFEILATLSNPDHRWRPGMFANVSVVWPQTQPVLYLPATSVLYAPYGDSVFVVEPPPEGSGLVLRQQFVTLGERRGDFVAVLANLKESDDVVNSGVFKLFNGQPVVIDNTLTPEFKLSPTPEDK